MAGSQSIEMTSFTFIGFWFVLSLNRVFGQMSWNHEILLFLFVCVSNEEMIRNCWNWNWSM